MKKLSDNGDYLLDHDEKDKLKKMMKISSNKKKQSIDIPVGMSDILDGFTNVFSRDFLEEKGLKIKVKEIPYGKDLEFNFFGFHYHPKPRKLKLVKVNGLTVVGDANTIFTYLGHSHWEVGIRR